MTIYKIEVRRVVEMKYLDDSIIDFIINYYVDKVMPEYLPTSTASTSTSTSPTSSTDPAAISSTGSISATTVAVAKAVNIPDQYMSSGSSPIFPQFVASSVIDLISSTTMLLRRKKRMIAFSTLFYLKVLPHTHTTNVYLGYDLLMLKFF